MEQTKHTPGPWKLNLSEYKEHEITNESGQMFIAQVYLFDADDKTKANAQLIASAPETAAERDSLKQWKEEATELFGKWNKVDEYIRNHSEVKLGASITDEALRFIQERDSLKIELENLKDDITEWDSRLSSSETERDKLKDENERLTRAYRSVGEALEESQKGNKLLVEALEKMYMREYAGNCLTIEEAMKKSVESDSFEQSIIEIIQDARAINP